MGKAPVFVDDSGTRMRLLRIAGVLISLLSVGFLTVVGVALAVPPVTTSVCLGGVAPFIVPGAAAPPPTKAPPARATRHPGTHHTGSGHPSPSGRQTGGQTPRFDRERALPEGSSPVPRDCDRALAGHTAFEAAAASGNPVLTAEIIDLDKWIAALPR